MTAPTIAVIIPARDAAAFIARAVRSARAESPEALIVVDDGSTDDTAARARAAGATVLRHAHARGASAARQTAAARCTTDALAFLDADDEYLPGFLADARRTLRAHPRAALVFGHAVEERDDGTRRVPPPFPAEHLSRPLWALAQANLVPTSAAVVPAWAYERSGGFLAERGSHFEDYDLWLRLSSLGPFASTGRLGVLRHVGDGSFSRRADALDPMLQRSLQAVLRHTARLAPSEARWFRRIGVAHCYREAARRALARGRADDACAHARAALRSNPADHTAWLLLVAARLPSSALSAARAVRTVTAR